MDIDAPVSICMPLPPVRPALTLTFDLQNQSSNIHVDTPENPNQAKKPTTNLPKPKH